MRTSTRTYTATALATALCSLSLSQAKDWPNWRGPSQNGSLPEGTFPTKWDSEEWKVALPGKGGSSPIVWDGTIYVTGPDGGENSVIAFDMKGEQLWQTKLGAAKEPKHKKLGSSSNSSPVTDGKGIYVYFKSGHFAALEMDGKVRWQKNLHEEFGPEKLYWDQGSSPVIVGDQVILTRLHGGESWVAAYDIQSGEEKWRQARNYDVPNENDNGYTTPVIFDHDGETALLIWCSDHLTAHSAKDGRVLWSCAGFNPDETGFWPAIATPVLVDDIAVVPVGRDDRKGQARVHGIKLGGEGDVTETHRVWKRDDIGVFVSTPVEYDGKVYLLRHRGGVVCLDPKTGDTIWEGEFPRGSASYYSSPVIAGGMLYAAREDGIVFTAKIGDKFEPVGEMDMGEQIIATPVPVDGRLLIRGAEHLFSVK